MPNEYVEPPLRAGAVRAKSPLGCIDVVPAADSPIVQLFMHGSQRGDFTEAVFPVFRATLGSKGSLLVFADTWELTDYEPKYRENFTSWFLANRKQLLGVHVLLKSKLVAMGVAMANLVLGGLIQSHRNPGDFERILQEKLRA